MSPRHRQRFDRLLESILDRLPPHVHELLEEAPVIVEDVPDPALLEELGLDPDEEILCGLHTGTPLTERSVTEMTDHPEMIHLFREAIVEEAGGWERWRDDEGTWWGGDPAVKEQIRITLLHEIGHHFGLEEDDLEGLGYA